MGWWGAGEAIRLVSKPVYARGINKGLAAVTFRSGRNSAAAKNLLNVAFLLLPASRLPSKTHGFIGGTKQGAGLVFAFRLLRFRH